MALLFLEVGYALAHIEIYLLYGSVDALFRGDEHVGGVDGHRVQRAYALSRYGVDKLYALHLAVEHGYAVDQREGVSSKGIRCAAFTVAAGEFVNVTVDSQFSMVAEAKMGEVTFKNCTFKVISQIEDSYDYMNAAIGAGYGVKLTLQGGSISGKYAIVLLPTGQTVNNNGATVSGRVADLLVYTMANGATSTETGLNNATRANAQ